MPKNLTLKGEVEEGLMEAVSLYSNFIDDLDKITALIDSNETIDHKNDAIRNDVIKYLLSALESYSAKSYEDMDRHIHSALQKLHSQELLDIEDDKPRISARVELAVIRQKAIHNTGLLTKILNKVGGKHAKR